MSLAISKHSSKVSYAEWKKYNSSFETSKKGIQSDSSGEDEEHVEPIPNRKVMVMATTAGVGGFRMYDHLLYNNVKSSKKNKAVSNKQQRYSYQSFGEEILP